MTELQPQKESWWLGFLKFQWVIILGVFTGLVWAYLPKVLEHFFPGLGAYIGMAVFWTLVILLVITLLRGLLKVFRPDDPADLSLK
jgi:hypothetical protein